MAKKTISHNKNPKKLSKKITAMKLHTKIVSAVVAVVIVVVGVIAVINTSQAQGVKESDSVPLVSTAQAQVTNVKVGTLGNTVNVQFDYDLVNGADSATVDAALAGQRSFDPVIVTGPGHYDKTLTDVADGTYYIAIIISGNPDYLLGDPSPANKPLVFTIPETNKTSNGDMFVRTVRHFFHQQQKQF